MLLFNFEFSSQESRGNLLFHICLSWGLCGLNSPVKVLWLDLFSRPVLSTCNQLHVILDDGHLGHIRNRIGGAIWVAEISIRTTVGEASRCYWEVVLVADGLSCWTCHHSTEADEGIQGVFQAMIHLSSSMHLFGNFTIEHAITTEANQACTR